MPEVSSCARAERRCRQSNSDRRKGVEELETENLTNQGKEDAMNYRSLLLVALSLFVFSCRPKQQLETTTIKAGSMVCGTCAKTIEKAVYAVEGVKEVNVDVKEKKVEVKFV